MEHSGIKLESVQQEARTCPACGAKLFAESEFCPVCILLEAADERICSNPGAEFTMWVNRQR